MKHNYPYTSHYCDENIWHLCKHPDFIALEKKVLVISNKDKRCLFNHHGPAPILWDYHFVLLGLKKEWQVWDLDSSLMFPCELSHYLSETFMGGTSSSNQSPEFLVIEATDFIKYFSSDRTHMIKEDGTWVVPPPKWPIINNEDEKYELKYLIDFNHHKSETINVAQLKELLL